MIRQTNSQIVRLVRSIKEETQVHQPEFRLKTYHGLLYDQVIRIDNMQDPKTIRKQESANYSTKPVVDSSYVRPPVLIDRRLPHTCNE